MRGFWNNGHQLATDFAGFVRSRCDAEIQFRSEKIGLLLRDGITGKIDQLNAGVNECTAIHIVADGHETIVEIEGVERAVGVLVDGGGSVDGGGNVETRELHAVDHLVASPAYVKFEDICNIVINNARDFSAKAVSTKFSSSTSPTPLSAN